DGARRMARLRAAVGPALDLGGGALIVATLNEPGRLYSTRRACPRCGAGLPVPRPRLFTWSPTFRAVPGLHGPGLDPAAGINPGYPMECTACSGSRLRPEALAVRIDERSIGEIAALTVSDARVWVSKLRGGAEEVRERIVPELEARLALLEELGVGYLAL